MVLLPFLAFYAAQATGEPQITVKDEVVGTGKEAKTGDIVDLDYTGKLTDGTEFDSNKGKDPFRFVLGLGEVIRGYDQGVLGMKEGGTRDITIPPELGYGDKGAPPRIPPSATLSFTVKLLKIEPPVEKITEVKGSGPAARMMDMVYGYVKASVKDGKTFSDSRDNEKDPIAMIQVGERGMPLGLITGLLGIQAGETRKITIPPSIAFGAKGYPPRDFGQTKAGSIVPPDSTVVFDVECTKVQTLQR